MLRLSQLASGSELGIVFQLSHLASESELGTGQPNDEAVNERWVHVDMSAGWRDRPFLLL